MTSASDLAAEISQPIPYVKRGSLVVFGDIFGGRIDNTHTVTAARAPGIPNGSSSSSTRESATGTSFCECPCTGGTFVALDHSKPD